MGEYEMNTISVNDVIKAYKRFDTSSLAEDVVLDFVSELTGLSIDRLIELMG